MKHQCISEIFSKETDDHERHSQLSQGLFNTPSLIYIRLC
jgi:hypothetical protein